MLVDMPRADTEESHWMNLFLSPKKFDEIYKRNVGKKYVVIHIPETMSPSKIKKIYISHMRSSYCNKWIMYEIAKHSRTPPEVLKGIFRKYRADQGMLETLASNRSTPLSLAQQLAKHGNGYVVWAAVHLPCLTIDHLRKIAKFRPRFKKQCYYVIAMRLIFDRERIDEELQRTIRVFEGDEDYMKAFSKAHRKIIRDVILKRTRRKQ